MQTWEAFLHSCCVSLRPLSFVPSLWHLQDTYQSIDPSQLHQGLPSPKNEIKKFEQSEKKTVNILLGLTNKVSNW